MAHARTAPLAIQPRMTNIPPIAREAMELARRGFALRLLDQLPKAPAPDRIDDEMDAMRVAAIVDLVALE